jgi:hypothetical protein
MEEAPGTWTIINNGGNGWKLLDLEDGCLLPKNRSKALKCVPYITSYEWCIRQYTFDLLAVKFI